uniref:Uncharacterized protein n=1 Tax=Arundo donax TaxID=35708 RepID=A0A0A9A255_ARUDO
MLLQQLALNLQVAR